MGRFERSIKIAFDKLSGEVLDADDLFDKKKEGFEIRRLFHERKLELSCCECEQDLNISTSKYDRLHFKHKPNHTFCNLADGELSPKELEKFTAILKAKESERHKQLKNKIGYLLTKVEGVDTSSIAIDDKFIIRDNEKRRPDVYCKYNDMELVFEIQLSDLSLGYILSRYQFYKKNGMYLIWILDNFDIHHQGTLERDLKYLTKYENFFKLDENSGSFQLECEYKFPFLTWDNKLLTKWLKKSITFNQINFDSESYQIYYYNFGDNRTKAENEQRTKTEEIKEAALKKAEELKLSNAKRKANSIKAKIKGLRKSKSQIFASVLHDIRNLNEYELSVFNKLIDLNNRIKLKTPPIFHWIYKATRTDSAFIEFILGCRQIEIDINERDIDGSTVIQAVYKNEAVYSRNVVKELLRRGYKVSDDDRKFISSIPDLDGDKKNDFLLYSICNELSNRELVDAAFTHEKLLFIIESAKHKKICGFNYKPNEWVAFANNTIQFYREYWEYIELAFRYYGLWDIIKQADKKSTFEKKVMNYYVSMPEQNYDFDEVFKDLFPELLH